MKKSILKKGIILISTISILSCFSCEKTSSININKDKKYHNGLIDTSCVYLSDKEKKFAKMLSDLHRQIFCKIFTESQRKKAIKLYVISHNSKKSNVKKNVIIAPINADKAIEIVVKSERSDN